MLKKTTFILISAFLISSTLFGCSRNANIINIERIIPSQNITLNQIENAIIQAGQSKGWAFEKKGKNILIASLNIRTHFVQIEISYSKTEYKIAYKNSTGMRYKNGTIHRKYNTWVKNLYTSINKMILGKVQSK